MKLNILQGDCREVLKTLETETFNCCVTSPPYFGLRDYGTGTWVGGDPECSHKRDSKKSDKTITGHKNFDEMGGVGDAIYKTICPKCGAVREDKQVGLEETPEEYVSKMVEIFREVKRVLRKDGTLWLNLGDSYSRGQTGRMDEKFCKDAQERTLGRSRKVVKGLKPKNLIGIPWRVAFALQADGWYLRQDIIWAKPNPMPEAVKDRCTKSHEYIFLFSKSKNYYYDYEAIKEDSVDKESYTGRKFRGAKSIVAANARPGQKPNSFDLECIVKEYPKRNKRDVWTVSTKPYRGAHFATFPPDLISPCILAGCPSAGNVLDPFGGSGTTGMVSEDLGRNCTLIELNNGYVDIIKQRTFQTGFEF